MRRCLLLALLFAACTDNMKVPRGIIAQPKMQKILWDMVQADRYVATYLQIRKDTLGRNRRDAVAVYDKVFAYNGVSRDEFLKSYSFYLGRPDMLKVMFDSVAAQAQRQKAESFRHPLHDSLSRHRLDSLRFPADTMRHRGDSVRRRFFGRPLPPRT